MDNIKHTEEKILHAAMNVFVKKGRYGAKMQEIADEANINKAMLHYYFRSKDKLYVKVFEGLFRKIFGSLHVVFKKDISFREKLTAFVDQYTDLIAQNSHIPLFIMRELSEGAEEIKPVMKELLAQEDINLPFTFIQSINDAIQKREIRTIHPAQLLITILGSVVFYFMAEPLLMVVLKNDPDFKREKFIEQRKKVVVDIILNGIKP